MKVYELSVLVGGRPVREYGHQGRTFIEGKAGSTFTLKFRNNLANRVLAVPSVDGLSAIDGNPATAESRGYVISGYSAAEIKGWRKDLGSSADFVFTDRSKSYAGQAAGAQNCGVIAVKVYAEVPKQPQIYYETYVRDIHHFHHHPIQLYPLYTTGGVGQITCSMGGSGSTGLAGNVSDEPVACYTAGLAASSESKAATQISAKSMAPAFNLGTGWGAEKADPVSECPFERGVELATLEIYYDDAAGLTAYGVQLNKELALSAPAFPVSFGGFCKAPKVTV